MLKVWRKSWPPQFKNIRITQKTNSAPFRDLLFKSQFLNDQLPKKEFIKKAIDLYNAQSNRKPLQSKLTRGEEEALNQNIISLEP